MQVIARGVRPRACGNSVRGVKTSAHTFSSRVGHRDSQVAAAFDPRWLSDLQGRIKALSGSAQRQDADKLNKTSDYLSSHWLELSAGREGFLTEERWRGLNKFGVAWGDMDSMVSLLLALSMADYQLIRATGASLANAHLRNPGHVNNIMYNRYAESGRVNWVTSFASNAPPNERQQWLDIMSPRGIGLILKSIKTDYKLPITYPDKITVIHKLAQRPTSSPTSIFLDAVIYSETHRRIAARCFEDIAVYNYREGKLSAMKPFMVEELQKVYDLQEKSRQETERTIKELEQSVRALEDVGSR